MKTKIAIVFSITLSLIPEFISAYQLLTNGGLAWPMLWGNEKRFWGLVFGLFAILAIILALNLRHDHPRFATVSIMLAVIATAPAIIEFSILGLGAASKMDTSELDILGFWTSKWWQ